MGNVTVKGLITDEMVEAAAKAYLEECSKHGFRNPVTDIEYSALRNALTAALTVPCLQEPVRYVSSRDGSVITPAHFDSIISKKDHFTPLYAQPIEVREQAIRECAEAAYSGILQKYGKWAALCAHASILALREGR